MTPPRIPAPELAFQAPPGVTLAAALRGHLPDRSWSEVRRLCERGKVFVDEQVVTDPAARLRGGESVSVRMTARAPERPIAEGFRLVHDDAHLVVIEKPAGVSSVPFEKRETGTAMDLIRAAWRQQGRKANATPLYVVHRLDKETSGLLCFGKTRAGEKGLHEIFQRHLADRQYVAAVHGHLVSERIESVLVRDRGDGIRGTARRPDRQQEGQHAVTHVTAVERLPRATVCRVRLETGRTHQIRIHLSERGHPVVGEEVYVRDFLRAGQELIRSTRLLLHAETLGFQHPVTGERLAWTAPLPADFAEMLERLRRG